MPYQIQWAANPASLGIRQSMKNSLVGWLGLWVALCLAQAGWAAGPEEKLEQEIARALTQGREMEACQLALKMKTFKGTPGYDRAKAQLLAKGISLEAPLESFTVKRMIDLQNKLEAERARQGVLPEVGPRGEDPDAWGNPLRVELITRRSFAYMIRSAGPDQRFMTDDDLAIGVRDNMAPEGRNRNLAPGLGGPDLLPGGGEGSSSAGQGGSGVADPARDAGRRGLYGVGAGPAPGARPAAGATSGSGRAAGAAGGPVAKPAPGERQVTVEELLK